MPIIEPTSAVMTGLLPIVKAFSDACTALDRAVYDTFVGEGPEIHAATVAEVSALIGTLEHETRRLTAVVHVVQDVMMGHVIEHSPGPR